MFLHIGNDKSLLIDDIVFIQPVKNKKDRSKIFVNKVKNHRVLETEIFYSEIMSQTLKKRIQDGECFINDTRIYRESNSNT